MINVLVLCDDLWHPAEVIELGLSTLEGDKFHFVYVKAAKDVLTPERIAEYPVIICCKGNVVTSFNNAPWFEEGVTEVCPKEFGENINAGGGFISLHSGNTARAGSDMNALIGNQFKGHPPRCAVDVKITGKHAIVEGISDFHIRDEHYQIDVDVDDATELFRTYSEKGGEQVGGYVCDRGEGRLCVLTPGHCADVFYNPEFNKILANAIDWCAKKI